MPECSICGSPVTERFWFCAACEAAYGLGPKHADWPEWAKYLKNEEKARRRRRDAPVVEIPVSLLHDCERAAVDRLLYGEPNIDN